MWWIFKKQKEDDEYVYYNFARESTEADGLLVYAINSNDPYSATIMRNSITTDSAWKEEQVISKFHHVVNEGFPEIRMVANG